jgi:hypothetical protein
MFFLTPSRDSLPGIWKDLRLDIVAIIAVLGDSSVTRNAQVSALSWYNIIPRLLPAPQALLKQERERNLPAQLSTQSGTIVSIRSGNVRQYLTFFTNVLHPHRLERYQVEFLQVTPKRGKAPGNAYGARPWSELFWLSVVGCAMSVALLILSAIYQDGMALLATLFLSAVSTLIGIGSHWVLDFPQAQLMPDKLLLADVVIRYPNGAFRVIRCTEPTSRLYFQGEGCRYYFEDTTYRSITWLAAILLMLGVICMSNSTLRLQLAFATAYIILNALYWGASAVNPLTHYWDHAFEITKFEILLPKGHNMTPKSITETENQSKWSAEVTGDPNTLKQRYRNWRRGYKMSDSPTPERTFTTALWIAIALTGTSKWLNDLTDIVPTSEAWKEWLALADQKAKYQLQFRAGRISSNIKQVYASTPHPIHIRTDWDYKKALVDILTRKKDFPRSDLERPESAPSQDTSRAIMESITEVSGPDLS